MKEHCQEDKKKTGNRTAKCIVQKKKNSFRFVLTKPLEPNMLQ